MTGISLQGNCNWVRKPNLLERQSLLRVCILNDCIYAVSYTYVLPILCYKYYIFYFVLNDRLAAILKIMMIIKKIF